MGLTVGSSQHNSVLLRIQQERKSVRKKDITVLCTVDIFFISFAVFDWLEAIHRFSRGVSGHSRTWVLGGGDDTEPYCCINVSSRHSHLPVELAHFHPLLKSKLGEGNRLILKDTWAWGEALWRACRELAVRHTNHDSPLVLISQGKLETIGPSMRKIVNRDDGWRAQPKCLIWGVSWSLEA